MQIVEFTRQLARFSAQRKVITIPEPLEEMLEKYRGKKLRITISTLDP